MREVMRKRQEGIPEVEEENMEEEVVDPFAMNEDEMMPSTEEMENQEYDNLNEYDDEQEMMIEPDAIDDSFISFALQRQTLLFTATGLETNQNKKVLQKSYLTKKQAKKLKLKGTVKGLASDCSLPVAIKE